MLVVVFSGEDDDEVMKNLPPFSVPPASDVSDEEVNGMNSSVSAIILWSWSD
jgi:hypothetical protein